MESGNVFRLLGCPVGQAYSPHAETWRSLIVQHFPNSLGMEQLVDGIPATVASVVGEWDAGKGLGENGHVLKVRLEI
jgi:hypothetical protein